MFIIDKDYFADAVAPKGSNANAVGVVGPRNADSNAQPRYKFRMLDADRNLVYEGRCTEDGSFEPLDCFGMPNFGCTIVQYQENGAWKDL